MNRLSLALVAFVLAAPVSLAGGALNDWESVQPTGADNAIGGNASRGIVAAGGNALFASTNNLYRRASWDSPWQIVEITIDGNAVVLLFNLTAHPTDPNRVYASAQLSNGQRSVIRSDDAGATFTTVYDVNLPPALVDIAPAAADPDTVYIAVPNEGLLRSADAGLTWTTVSATLPATRRDLTVDAADVDTLYALDNGLPIRSTDSGATFVPSATGVDSDDLLLGLWVSPANASTVVTASRLGTRLYRSTDGALTWSPIDVAPGLGAGDVANVLVDPTDADRLLVSAGEGQNAAIFETLDAGATWTALSDPDDTDGAGQLVWTADGNVVSFADTGVIRLVDGELQAANEGFNEFLFDGLRLSGGASVTGYGYSQGGGIVATAPALPLWANRRQGIGTSINELVRVPGDSLQLWAATGGGLLRSFDGGLSWSVVPAPGALRKSTVSLSPLAITSLYTLDEDGLYVSADDGATWQPGLLAADYPAGGVRSMIIPSGAAANRAFTLTNASGLLVTDDGGLNWTVLEAPFEEQRVNDLVNDPLLPEGLYAATDDTVWRSQDDGATWSPLGDGAAFNVIFALVADPVIRGRVFARDNQGVWALDTETNLWSLLVPPPPGPNGVVILGETLAGDNETAGRLYDSLSTLWRLQLDTDGDGIGDDVDTCILTPNVNQFDGDGDGLGNLCDADIAPADNDCVINVQDLGELRVAFFATPESDNWNPAADFNVDGVINVQDLGLMRTAFFGAPGVSTANTDCR